jgi:hypothetical protein
MTMNWRSVASKSVHAQAASSTVPMNLSANPRITANIPIQIPNLWVENGVIWQLPSLLIGFTSYSAVTKFFASLQGTGMGPPPSQWYQGKPFSSVDFPLLYDQYEYTKSKTIKPNASNSDATKSNTVWGACNCLIWPSLTALSSVKMFFSMAASQVTPVHGNANSAGPVVPISAISSFLANSPAGTNTFRAQYVMYVPGGITTKVSGSGIQYDMSKYAWTRKWIVKQYDSGQKSSGSSGGAEC